MPPPVASTINSRRASNCPRAACSMRRKPSWPYSAMTSATDNPFCASISLFSSTKLQPIFFASILPSVDLPAPPRPTRGTPANEISAHRIRHPAQQHDRDVALAAFELGDITFGNAGDFGEHLSRHPVQRAHGADTLAELLEKAGFGIGIFGHAPWFAFVRRPVALRGRWRFISRPNEFRCS